MRTLGIPSNVTQDDIAEVDEVFEFADSSVFPAAGESGKIYLALDNGKLYRWSGSVYIDITSGTQTGAIQFNDTTYTTSSRFSLSADTRTQLPNNKGFVLNVSAPTTATTWIDNTGKITPDNGVGDSYMLRVTFTASAAQNNSSLVCELDIGGSQGVIWSKTENFTKGAGVDVAFSLTMPHYTLGTFQSNGGILYLTASSSVDVFNISYLLEKIKAN